MHTSSLYVGSKLQSCSLPGGHVAPKLRIDDMHSRLTFSQTDLHGFMDCGNPFPAMQMGTDMAHKKNTNCFEQFVLIRASYCWNDRQANVCVTWNNGLGKRVMLYGIDLHDGINTTSQAWRGRVRETTCTDKATSRQVNARVEDMAYRDGINTSQPNVL